MAKRISIRQAILVGVIWVNGSVLLGLIVPVLVIGIGGIMIANDPSSALANLGPVIVGMIVGFVCAWLAWSSQISHWRLWAYRRVTDIDALKVAATSAGLIWPEGHVFGRTEFRSRDQMAELHRLEADSAARKESEPLPQAPSPPTRAGTACKSLILGLALTPASVLAPAGALSIVGVEVTDSPIFLGLLVLFPLVLATVIYTRARGDRVSADEAFRRILPFGRGRVPE
jgi:hypothetical protein